MSEVLIVADTVRSPELRHEVPVSIGDPFFYAERDGTRYVFVSALEVPRLAALDGLVTVPLEEIGFDELIAAGVRPPEADRELALRAARHAGLSRAVVPRTFPLEIADHLRAHGVAVEPDGKFFDHRRRVKTDAELEGITRALRASEHAMARVRERLGAGDGVTCEELRTEILRVFTDVGVASPDLPIVSHGAQTAVGHEPGHGRVERGEPLVVDIFPQDPESGCFSDMTRTFCVGEPPAELVEYQRLCRDALGGVYERIRPGVTGAELHRVACDVFEAAGYPTQLTKQPGEVLSEGFYHSLGHGVGLEVHEAPALGRRGEELVAGDVVAVEPGCYRPGFGGCRLEDLVLVTEDGCEVLTDFPYELAV